jgi:hypothetical protein
MFVFAMGCPKCGAPVSDTDFACRNCGMSFVPDPSAALLDPYQSAYNKGPSQISAMPVPPPPPPAPFVNASTPFADAPAPFVDAPPAYPFPPPNPYAPGNAYAPAPGAANLPSASAQARSALNYALLGFFCFGFYFGFKAVSRARAALRALEHQPQMPGRSQAEMALLLGYVDIALWVLGICWQIAGRR